MINETFVLWGGFTLFIAIMLALDLGVFQRKAHVISMKEALTWFGVWTALALIFNVGIVFFHDRGGQAGLEFFTGFLVEKSLSVDNIFVFLLIFNYFQVPQSYQHKVLFWGIVGAIVLRIAFILGGVALLENFHWMNYVFGAFLLLTGITMMYKKEAQYDPSKNWVIRNFKRIFPVSPLYDGNRFFTRVNGTLMATPLFVVLLAVESSDIVFAVDSIPAIFAITNDPFIVYTSNIFAMLGLRSLYFAVSGFMRMFHFLHYGFASIILILGIKMLLSDVYKMPTTLSLVMILVILLLCVIVSLLRPRRQDLKMMFERPEKMGLIPFRRLLLIENVVDMGDVTVKDTMKPRSAVRSIRLDVPWEENMQLIRETRFSRYPLVESKNAKPIGALHIKDLLLLPEKNPTRAQLLRMLRPCPQVREDMPLEDALSAFQRKFQHLAMVVNEKNEWTGIVTFEDVLEELVGKIDDEFDSVRSGRYVSAADALTPGRIVFGVEGEDLSQAVEYILEHIPADELPVDASAVRAAILKREADISTYLGDGLAVPHCRLDGLEQPVLIFGRSEDGIPQENSNERAELIFLVLTPSHMARIQPRLLADIVGLIESEYVTERLRKATNPEDVIEAVRDGMEVALD